MPQVVATTDAFSSLLRTAESSYKTSESEIGELPVAFVRERRIKDIVCQWHIEGRIDQGRGRFYDDAMVCANLMREVDFRWTTGRFAV